MKKILVILMLISLVVCLSAQQGGKIRPKQQQTKKVVQAKMDYELEFNKLNDAYKALIDKEREIHIKWRKLTEKHNKYIQTYKVNQADVDALKTERERLRNGLQLQLKNNKTLKSENVILKKENARLKAKLESMKPKKKKVTKTVTPSS